MENVYVIYHKGGGYLQNDGNYTDNIKEARFFNTEEGAEIEICCCGERVEVYDKCKGVK